MCIDDRSSRKRELTVKTSHNQQKHNSESSPHEINLSDIYALYIISLLKHTQLYFSQINVNVQQYIKPSECWFARQQVAIWQNVAEVQPEGQQESVLNSTGLCYDTFTVILGWEVYLIVSAGTEWKSIQTKERNDFLCTLS